MPVSVQEFAGKIKQKYPEYQGVDDYTLTQKMVEKYPQYKSQVDFGGNVSQNTMPQQPQQQGGDDFWGGVNRMLNPFAAPSIGEAMMSPEDRKKAKQAVDNMNQTMYEAPRRAIDWLGENTQGFRDWIDQTAESTGLNDWAEGVTKWDEQTRKDNPVYGGIRFGVDKAVNTGAYAIPAVIEGFGNQVKALGNPLGLGSLLEGAGDVGTELADQATQNDQFAKTVGGITGNIASQIPAFMAGSGILGNIFKGGSAVGAGTKALTAGSQVAKGGANVAKTGIVQKAIQGAPKFVADSILGTEIASAATRGEGTADLGEILAGLGIDTALFGAGKFVKKGVDLFTGKNTKDIVKPLMRKGVKEETANIVSSLDEDLKQTAKEYIKIGLNKIKDPLNNPNVFDVPGKEFDDFLETARNKKEELGIAVSTAKQNMADIPIDTRPIKEKLEAVLRFLNVKTGKPTTILDPTTKLFNFKPKQSNLDFSYSQIKDNSAAVNKIKEINEFLSKNQNIKAGDLEGITGQIDEMTGLLKSTGYKSSAANKALTDLKKTINEVLGAASGEFKKANSAYADYVTKLTQIENAANVPLGNGQTTINGAQVLRRVLGVADKKYKNAIELVEALGKEYNIPAPKDLIKKAHIADFAEKTTGSAPSQGLNKQVESAVRNAIGGKAGPIIEQAKAFMEYVSPQKASKNAAKIQNILTPSAPTKTYSDAITRGISAIEKASRALNIPKTAYGFSTQPEQKKTITEFAQLIKQMYPEYADIEDEQLVMAFLSKFPERMAELQL